MNSITMWVEQVSCWFSAISSLQGGRGRDPHPLGGPGSPGGCLSQAAESWQALCHHVLAVVT